MEVDGELKDLKYNILKDSSVDYYIKDKEGIEVIRHDAAHIMAMAVQSYIQALEVTIGPVIENGFNARFALKRNHL